MYQSPSWEAKLANTFATLFGNPVLSSVFERVRHLSLSGNGRVHSWTSYFFKSHFNIIFLCTPRCCKGHLQDSSRSRMRRCKYMSCVLPNTGVYVVVYLEGMQYFNLCCPLVGVDNIICLYWGKFCEKYCLGKKLKKYVKRKGHVSCVRILWNTSLCQANNVTYDKTIMDKFYRTYTPTLYIACIYICATHKHEDCVWVCYQPRWQLFKC
jgi:hypothetical protein